MGSCYVSSLSSHASSLLVRRRGALTGQSVPDWCSGCSDSLGPTVVRRGLFRKNTKPVTDFLVHHNLSTFKFFFVFFIMFILFEIN